MDRVILITKAKSWVRILEHKHKSTGIYMPLRYPQKPRVLR